VPQTPCLRCRALCNGSYCPRHRPSRRSAARGSGGAQATFRRRTLAKYGERCFRCGSTNRVEAHHVHPLAEDGSQDDVGVPLCWQCHRRAER
jgi:hypothetical protein